MPGYRLLLIAFAMVLASPAAAMQDSVSLSQEVAAEIERIAAEEQAAYDAGNAELSAELGLKLYELRKQHLGDRHPQTIDTYDNYAVSIGALGRSEEAERIHRQSVAMSREVEGISRENKLFYIANHASILLELGRYDEAMPLLQEAYQGRLEALGAEHPETLYSLERLASLTWLERQYEEAKTHYSALVELKRRGVPEVPETLESLLSNLALVNSQLGQFADTAAIREELASIYETSLGPIDEKTLLNRELWLNALTNSGQQEAALDLAAQHRDALAAGFGSDDKRTLRATVLYGQKLSDLKRFEESLAILRPAITKYREVAGPDDPEYLAMLNNLAGALASRGRTDEALEIFDQIVTLVENAGDEVGVSLGIVLNNQGFMLRQLGELDRARAVLTRAVELNEAQLGPNHPFTILSDVNLAGVMSALNEHGAAEERLRPLLERSEALGQSDLQMLTLLYELGVAILAQGDSARAQPYLERAHQANRAAYGPLHYETLTALGPLMLARLLSEEPAESVDIGREMFAGLRERRRILGFDPASQAGSGREFAGRNIEFGALAYLFFGASIVLEDQSEALQLEALAALQEATGNPASQAMAQTAARREAERVAGLGAIAREREQLSEQWLELERASVALLAGTQASPSGSLQDIEEAKIGVADRLQAIDERFRREAPAFFSLIRPQALERAEIERLLRPDEAAILMVPSPFGTMAVAIADGQFQHVVSDLAADEIAERVNMLRADLDPTTLGWGNAERLSFNRTVAHELYRELISPLEEVLDGKRHVFIAASGALAALPPGVLITAKPQGEDDDPEALRATEWFADRHALVQIPSLQALQFLRRDAGRRDAQKKSGALSFRGFGDPALDGKAALRGARGVTSDAMPEGSALLQLAGSSADALVDPEALRALAELPGTRAELEQIRVALNAAPETVFVRSAATETNVRSADLSKVDILAFATHALLPGEIEAALEPGLVLTPPQSATLNDDGYLAASEVAGLDLAAQWVILSACNTAGASEPDGDALSGLARAFFFAGSQALLVSHWPVFDAIAPELTTRTITLQRDDPEMSRAEALSRAMRSVRESTDDPSYAHPSAWAPFVLVGDAY